MAVYGIHHVSMKCGSPENLPAVKAFYCDLLGLKVVREWPDGIMIGTGAGMIEVFTTGDEIEMTIPHKEEIPYEPIVIGDMEEKEDSDFELETPETLADKLQQDGDHSLAAKLQHSSVNNLNNAIGINDKFLLVNELFGGSMEKYNKSINNLNDLKTLEGALVYMNELRIDLQWNSNNEAYKKLLELVHRKFD